MPNLSTKNNFPRLLFEGWGEGSWLTVCRPGGKAGTAGTFFKNSAAKKKRYASPFPVHWEPLGLIPFVFQPEQAKTHWSCGRDARLCVRQREPASDLGLSFWGVYRKYLYHQHFFKNYFLMQWFFFHANLLLKLLSISPIIPQTLFLSSQPCATYHCAVSSEPFALV